jgi:hypothetical protein
VDALLFQGSEEPLDDAIGHVPDSFSPGECRNYLANSGYEFE